MERGDIVTAVFREGRAWVYAMFAAIVLSASLGGLSQTGLNAMLSQVCSEFGISTGVGQWLATIYMFVIGAIVPLSSFFMGRFRTKDLVLLSAGLFIGGALLAACAPNFWTLLFARIMQACATGLLMPLTQTFSMTRFPEGRKATAMGISGIAMGFAPNIGPTIGGSMVDAFGWRSFFWMLAGIALAIALACAFLVQRHDDASYPAGIDPISFVLCTTGFGGILMACSYASSYAVLDPHVWAPAVVGVATLVAFFLRQTRIERPMVDPSIFKSRSFNAGFAALCLLTASFMGITLLVPLYIQGLCGGTAFEAGIVLLPGTVTALVMNPLAGYLTDKIGVRPVTVVAGLFLATGSTMMAFCDASTSLGVVACIQAIRQIGVSSLIGPLTSFSLSQLKGKCISDGSGFGLAARQTSASVGTALMVFCLEGAGLAGEMSFHAAFGVSAVCAIGCLLVILRRVR